MREVVTYSFISGKAIDLLNLPESDPRRQAITLLNPLGEEYSTMRTQLLTSMLTVLSTNYSRKIPAVRFFEAGKRFEPKALPLTEQPDEVPVLCLGLYGEGEDFFSLKGLVEAVFAAFGLQADYTAGAEPYFHPGRQAAASVEGAPIAVFGELHPDVAEKAGIDTRVYAAEIQLRPLFAAARPAAVYKPLPRFPAVERDLALVCDEDMPGRRNRGGRSDPPAAACSKRPAVRRVPGRADRRRARRPWPTSLFFRSPDGTLSDADIDPILQKIFKKLQEKGCILRS